MKDWTQENRAFDLEERLRKLESAAARELVVCTSPDGWSLHAPGSSDEAIACGDAPPLASGHGIPRRVDFERALANLREPAFMCDLTPEEQRAREGWSKCARLYKLDPAWLGRTYTRPTGEPAMILGIEPARSKFPVVVRRDDGLIYHVSANEVRRHVHSQETAS